MEPGDIPLLAMLKGRLGYLSDRQRVIAENVANSDTPGYKSRDLKAFSFQAHVQAASGSAPGSPSGTSNVAATPAGVMAVTQPGHMQPKGAPMGVKPVKAPDSEVTLDGNGVVLEDEMVKLTQARMDYDAAIGFYQKSIGLLKMAIRKPGAG
jgi:flagellar basal-body rod protein FlgB